MLRRQRDARGRLSGAAVYNARRFKVPLDTIQNLAADAACQKSRHSNRPSRKTSLTPNRPTGLTSCSIVRRRLTPQNRFASSCG